MGWSDRAGETWCRGEQPGAGVSSRAQRMTGVGQMVDARPCCMKKPGRNRAARPCRRSCVSGYGLPKPYLASTADPSGPVTNLMNAAPAVLSLEALRMAMG